MVNNSNKSNHNQVAYQPLTNLGTIGETELELEDELNEVIAGGQADEASSGSPSARNLSSLKRHYSRQHGRAGAGIGLRQLRTILLVLAAVLLLIFILKLATYGSDDDDDDDEDEEQHHNRHRFSAALNHASATHRQDPQSSVAANLTNGSNNQSGSEVSGSSEQQAFVYSAPLASSRIASSQQQQLAINSLQDKRPEYDNYLSSIIYERDHKAEANTSAASASITLNQLDDFRVSLGDGRSQTRDGSDDTPRNRNHIKWWSIYLRAREFATVTNYIRAMKSFNYNSSVTFATHLALDSDSFHHTLELCERWDGPISVAVHLSRGLDELPVAISLIKFARQCLPAPLSACMRDKLTWHLVFALDKPDHHQSNRSLDLDTLTQSLSYPKYHLDAVHYSSFANTDQCPKLATAEAPELIKQFQRDIMTKNKPNNSSRLISSNGVPIATRTPLNVLRNVAQAAATTKFVLVAYVDLYPSLKLAPNFIDFLQGNQMQTLELRRSLFVLPAFEMAENQQQPVTPKTKRELVDLIATNKATLYRESNCDRCHEFPNHNDWLQEADSSKVSPANLKNQSDKLTVFKQILWDSKSPPDLARRWQPFFIATSSVNELQQYFSEDILRSRVDLMYEACLLNYRLIVLDNAFLFRVNFKDQTLNIDNKETNLLDSRDQNKAVQMRLTQLKLKYKDSANINKC